MIEATDFKEMLLFSPDIKLDLINGIVNNPYDFDRDYFVQKCQFEIPIFQNLDVNFLKQLYYRCETNFYEQDQIIFEAFSKCGYLYIIMQGVVGIELLDKDEQPYLIDIMGRGSIMGLNNVIKGEEWLYRASAQSSRSTVIIQISRDLLKQLSFFSSQLQQNFDYFQQYNELNSIPQIDYIITNESFSRQMKEERYCNIKYNRLFVEGKLTEIEELKQQRKD